MMLQAGRPSSRTQRDLYDPYEQESKTRTGYHQMLNLIWFQNLEFLPLKTLDKVILTAKLQLEFQDQFIWDDILRAIKDDKNVDINDCLTQICRYGHADLLRKFLDAFPKNPLRIDHKMLFAVPLYAAASNFQKGSMGHADCVWELLMRYPGADYHTQVLIQCADPTAPGYHLKPILRERVLQSPKLIYEVLSDKRPFLLKIMAKPTAYYLNTEPEEASTLRDLRKELARHCPLTPEQMTAKTLQKYKNLQALCSKDSDTPVP